MKYPATVIKISFFKQINEVKEFIKLSAEDKLIYVKYCLGCPVITGDETDLVLKTDSLGCIISRKFYISLN
jgi:hypothetical protein